jgi:outer membrane protein assembly factor BamB
MRSFLAAALLCCVPAIAAADGVITYHNGNHRHGAYVVPDLTLAAAAKIQRDIHFNASVNGHVYAQPLYWSPKGASRGEVIVATESNDVYALDGNTGATVWHTALGHSVPRSALPCGNIDPVGVTGTPVIDPTAGVLYLDALMATKNGPRHRIYAISLSNGAVLPKWPLDVESAITKQGGSFTSTTQGERSALLFFGNRVYVNYAGNDGDCGTYYGTVLQIATDPPSLEAHWQTRAVRGGIWAQGGLAGDGQFLYATTGNTSGASTWSDGEAIIKLRSGLAHSTAKKDYFAPANWKDLDDSDKDLGATEALPLNIAAADGAVQRVIAFGKDGNAYLTDRRNLGGIGGAIAVTPVANSAIRTAPAIYQTDSKTMVAFTNPGSSHCSGNNITMLKVAASGASPVSFAWCAAFSGGGNPILTTTDGQSNAIVWVVGAEGDNQLHGFNAFTGQTVFAGTGTAMSGLHHFQTLIATHDRLYVAADGTVFAFKWK